MARYCFFMKNNKVFALDVANQAQQQQLAENGFERLPEEIEAADADRALVRFADNQKHEKKAAAR